MMSSIPRRRPPKGFSLLLSEGRIAGIRTRNRIVMPAMGMNMSDAGFVNDAIVNHYEARAKGGVGMIVVEVTCVDAPLGLNTGNMLAIDDDRHIPGMRRLTEAIHRHGAACVLQISHTGRGAKRRVTGGQPVGPSAVAMPFTMTIGLGNEEPRALAVPEIRAIEDKYAEAALRARQAGFDGVEVHATGYYLVSQFLSRTANLRRDEYGGSARKRAAFALNILKKIKARAGADFPVLYKLSILELGRNGGISLFDGLLYAHLLEKHGADAIEVLAMSYRRKPTLRDKPDTAQGKGLTFPLAMLLKTARVVGSARPNLLIGRRAVTIPLIAGGRAFEPGLGETALRKGRCDFVFMGRGLLAEPGLPRMIADGTHALARPCIGCGRCVDNQLHRQDRALCSGNAVLGNGVNDYSLPGTAAPRDMLVVGGGVAGMEAARIAALRGHRVRIFEKGPRLGGQLLLAVRPPHKRNLEPLLGYYERQLAAAGVEVHLGRELGPAEVLDSGADVVLCATGVKPARLPIPGFELPHVLNAKSVLAGRPVGRNVVILGGGLVGCETAEFLLRRGKHVGIVEMLPELAGRMVTAHRIILLGHLDRLGVRTYTSARCVHIDRATVLIEDGGGRRRSIKADTVITAVGDRPDTALFDAIRHRHPNAMLIGDALKPEGIGESVRAGYYAALGI